MTEDAPRLFAFSQFQILRAFWRRGFGLLVQKKRKDNL